MAGGDLVLFRAWPTAIQILSRRNKVSAADDVTTSATSPPTETSPKDDMHDPRHAWGTMCARACIRTGSSRRGGGEVREGGQLGATLTFLCFHLFDIVVGLLLLLLLLYQSGVVATSLVVRRCHVVIHLRRRRVRGDGGV